MIMKISKIQKLNKKYPEKDRINKNLIKVNNREDRVNQKIKKIDLHFKKRESNLQDLESKLKLRNKVKFNKMNLFMLIMTR